MIVCRRQLCRYKSSLSGQHGSLLDRYANRTPTPVSIQQMMVAQKGESTSQWLRNEMLVRLARRYRDLQGFPSSLIERDHFKRVTLLYYNFFEALAVMDMGNEEEFTDLLDSFYTKDAGTIPTLAIGLREWRHANNMRTDRELDARLDDMFASRLSIRMLIGQHLSMARYGVSRIQRGLVVSEAVQGAIDDASKLCIQRFGACPEVIIEGHTQFKFTYVPSHLHHMIFELVKNSVRAVVEQHQGEVGRERRKRLTLSSEHHLGPDGLPPVRVAISGGKEDVVIKVSDEGGGIARSDLPKIWTYEYTTESSGDVAKKSGNQDPSGKLHREESVHLLENFYGTGYGLPIARVFARYFGGDMRIVSTEGWGTDAYVFLNRLESNAIEVLPE